MAAIITDGPGVWARDVLDRNLDRVIAGLVGAKLLAAVFVIHPGPARLALAVGSVALLCWAFGVIPTRRPPAPPVRTCPDPDIEARLAELERALFNLQAWGKTRAAHTQERLDVIKGMVAEVADQVR